MANHWQHIRNGRYRLVSDEEIKLVSLECLPINLGWRDLEYLDSLHFLTLMSYTMMYSEPYWPLDHLHTKHD